MWRASRCTSVRKPATCIGVPRHNRPPCGFLLIARGTRGVPFGPPHFADAAGYAIILYISFARDSAYWHGFDNRLLNASDGVLACRDCCSRRAQRATVCACDPVAAVSVPRDDVCGHTTGAMGSPMRTKSGSMVLGTPRNHGSVRPGRRCTRTRTPAPRARRLAPHLDAGLCYDATGSVCVAAAARPACCRRAVARAPPGAAPGLRWLRRGVPGQVASTFAPPPSLLSARPRLIPYGTLTI